MSISNDVASLPGSYAEVPVNPRSCSIMTGYTKGRTDRVDAVFLHREHDKGTFLNDAMFVVTGLGVPPSRQSVSVAKNYLTHKGSNAISTAGGFFLRVPGMDDILMSSSQNNATPRFMVDCRGVHPRDGTVFLRMSSATVSAVERGTTIFKGVTEWSQPVDGSSEPVDGPSEPVVFQCHLEPAAWIV